MDLTLTAEYLDDVERTCARYLTVPSEAALKLVGAYRQLQWELENQKKLAAYYRDGARAGWGDEDDAGAGTGTVVGVRAGSA